MDMEGIAWAEAHLQVPSPMNSEACIAVVAPRVSLPGVPLDEILRDLIGVPAESHIVVLNPSRPIGRSLPLEGMTQSKVSRRKWRDLLC